MLQLARSFFEAKIGANVYLFRDFHPEQGRPGRGLQGASPEYFDFTLCRGSQSSFVWRADRRVRLCLLHVTPDEPAWRCVVPFDLQTIDPQL